MTCQCSAYHRVTVSTRRLGDLRLRVFRCHKCQATWRTVEVPDTQEALERAYKRSIENGRKRCAAATRRQA